MSEQKMDISKVLAILAQPKEKPEPLEQVDRLCMEIPYITKEGSVEKRSVRVVIPQKAEKPMPLIYVPHYEMGEDALELRDYLKEGWAVACPAEFDDRYNGTLTDDDLVFNNAALYALRRRPEFDRRRIAVVGGSAGGYMALMLSGLQTGLCATIANGPITNVYFNFHHYFQKANALNLAALSEIAAKAGENTDGAGKEEENRSPLSVLQKLKDLPIPFLAGLAGMFAPIENNFPDETDTARWEALSPLGSAECFSSPVMINHCTSDVLVPVDQISRSCTYPQPGKSLPKEFDMRLPNGLPGKLKYSLEELLPKEQVRITCIQVPENAPECILPYDSGKQFNINLFDDGPAEGYGTHSSRMDTGRRLDVPYLREMFEKTSLKTCGLTSAMMKRLVERYEGKSIVLPAHEGVDDRVYGSLNIYQKEAAEELEEWKKDHGDAAFEAVFDEMIKSEKENGRREELRIAVKKMESMFKGIA